MSNTLFGILVTVALVGLIVGVVLGTMGTRMVQADKVAALEAEVQQHRNTQALEDGTRPALVGLHGRHRGTPVSELPVYAYGTDDRQIQVWSEGGEQ